MQELIYILRFVNRTNSNQTIAYAPSIAGFYGVYTAIKPDYYGLSYNVRYSSN